MAGFNGDGSLVGRFRGRGWSSTAAWRASCGELGVIIRADDPEHPELWGEAELRYEDVILLYRQAERAIEQLREELPLEIELLSFDLRYLAAHCGVCGLVLDHFKADLFCSSDCRMLWVARRALATGQSMVVVQEQLQEFDADFLTAAEGGAG